MASRLLEEIAELMEVDASAITDESSNDSVETWDSLREVQLGLHLETRFSIALSDEDIARLRSIREVRAVLLEHGVSDPDA